MSRSDEARGDVAERPLWTRSPSSTRTLAALAAVPVLVIALGAAFSAFDLPTNTQLPVSATYNPSFGTWTDTAGGCDAAGVMCGWTGTFHPTDGGNAVRDVYLAPMFLDQIKRGDTLKVEAVPEGSTYWVYPLRTGVEARSPLFWAMMAASIGVLLFGCWLLVWATRGRAPGLARFFQLERQLSGPAAY